MGFWPIGLIIDREALFRSLSSGVVAKTLDQSVFVRKSTESVDFGGSIFGVIFYRDFAIKIDFFKIAVKCL